MLQQDASPYIISIMLHNGHCQHSCCNMIHHHTSSLSSNIIAIVSNHAATWCITLHHLHQATLWPLQAFLQQHDASLYIISIIQHYGKRKQSCCNRMHHPTSSPSCYFIATVSIHAATLSIILHHLHHPTLLSLYAIMLQHNAWC